MSDPGASPPQPAASEGPAGERDATAVARTARMARAALTRRAEGTAQAAGEAGAAERTLPIGRGAKSGQATIKFGYGTNGFADHRLDDALAVLADLGYDGVALTLDHHHLDPYGTDLVRRVSTLATRLERLGLRVVIETGARYLLDPRHKHQPTLLSETGRERRVDLLVRAVTIAADLGADAVSFWSGAKPAELPEHAAWQRLIDGCEQVLAAADRRRVPLGFEPEPGMFVDMLDGYFRLLAELGDPERFGLTLDIGHCRCLEPAPIAECVRRSTSRLVNVQIEDMRRGVHEHLEFGEGEIDFPPVLSALAEAGYRGLVSVELPRHSHAAPAVARRSLEFLRGARARAFDAVPAVTA